MTVERQAFGWLHDRSQSIPSEPAHGSSSLNAYQDQTGPSHFEQREDAYGNIRTVEIDQNGQIVGFSPIYSVKSGQLGHGNADIKIQVRDGDQVEIMAKGSWSVLKQLGILRTHDRATTDLVTSVEMSSETGYQETEKDRKKKQVSLSPNFGRIATKVVWSPGTRKVLAGCGAAAAMFFWLTPEGTGIDDVFGGFEAVGSGLKSGPSGAIDLGLGIARTMKEAIS